MNYRELNDYELVSLTSQSEEALDILFEKYKPLIESIANKIYSTNKNIGIEYIDIVQEGMVGFAYAINSYKEQKDALFFTYARKCIEGKMISYVVGANRQKHRILNSSVSMDQINSKTFNESLDKVISDTTSNPESILVDIENVVELVEAVRPQLTDFECEVFDLKKSGFKYREIAEVLDKDPKTIDNAIQRIRVKIKRYIEDEKNQ